MAPTSKATERLDGTKDFVISRTLDAPRDLVWKAWTDPQHLRQWWGPKGFEVVTCDIDLRPGGVFHYGLKGPDGSTMWGKWVFREIKAPELLVVVVSFSDANRGITRHPMAANWPLETLSRTTFTEKDGKTTMSLHWRAINATPEEIALFDASHDSMTGGFSGTFEQLTAYLAKAQQR